MRSGNVGIVILSGVFISVIGGILMIATINNKTEKSEKDKLISSAKLIIESAERLKIIKEMNGETVKAFKCKDVISISLTDYDSCNVRFNDDKAILDISSENMSVCNATRDNIVVTEGKC